MPQTHSHVNHTEKYHFDVPNDFFFVYGRTEGIFSVINYYVILLFLAGPHG